MFRLSLIVTLTTLICVSSTLPTVPNAEAHNVTSSEPSSSHLENVSNSTGNNDTTPPPTRVADETTQPGEKENATSTRGPTVTEATIAPGKDVTKKNGTCNYEKEQTDMLNCHVTPKDDDDDDDQQQKNTSPTAETETTTHVEKETTTNSTIDVPVFFPNDTSVKSIVDADETIVAKLNLTIYETLPPEADNVTEESTTENSNVVTNTGGTEKSGNSTMLTLADDMKVIGLENIAETAKSMEEEENKAKSMPSGIIALVTAITFAIAVVIAYISMIAWRRYLEYRYGHRELLVNDLEFDTNDLRHFEL